MKQCDPTLDIYRPLPEVPFDKTHTALLVVDMQYVDAARGYGIFAAAREMKAEYALDYYFNQLAKRVIPNIKRLQDTFRRNKMELIYTKIEALTLDGRERSREHVMMGILVPKGSKDGQILEEVAPMGDEMVISKTASGVFNSTNIEYILRNLGITGVVVVGVVTNECVETAVRDAADRGFLVTLVEDGCTALKPELHSAAITALGHTYARIRTTEQVIQEIEEK